jgi:tyrosyl-tRNA synthetase
MSTAGNDFVPTTAFLRDLSWRGLIHQTTGLEALDAHLAGGVRKGYVGFDPTAPSLTIGNLVGIISLVRLAMAGHSPVVVVGGATGLIGDPSGKSAERALNTPETVSENVKGQTRIYHSVWKNAAELTGKTLGEPRILNNYDWFKNISFLDALRDIGKHFSVNMMIQKESVKERLTNRDQGISYTEFSYMLLQAYDYNYLWEKEIVTLQMGGSDQFGNIVCGIDLLRRKHGEGLIDRAEDARAGRVRSPNEPVGTYPVISDQRIAHGLTWPLVTKADGGKFGKTETGAIWLTADRTSPYAFYQFWLNASDADVGRFLRVFTLLPREEIEALEASHASNPGAREAHRALARHMTALLHGREAMELAERAAKALFSGEVAGLPAETLEEALSGAPSSELDRAVLEAGMPLVDVLVTTGLAGSKREAREFLGNGSVSVNGEKAGPDDRLTTANLLHGRFVALRRGKKNWHLMRVK